MRDTILEIVKVIIYVFFLAVLVLEPVGIYITSVVGMLAIAYVFYNNISESIIKIIDKKSFKKKPNIWLG